MNGPPYPFPSAEEGLRLHGRLGELDPTAPADVCRAYLTPLLRWLEARFPRVDPHLRETAAGGALLAYVQNPQAYHPARADLAAYLRLAARHDLLNLLEREKRHQAGRVPWSVVEEDDEARYITGREPEPSAVLEGCEEAEQRQEFLQAIGEGFTPEENGVLELMLAGERKTAVYAARLGLAGLPRPDQEREVKRLKDRIKNRIKRGGRAHG